MTTKATGSTAGKSEGASEEHRIDIGVTQEQLQEILKAAATTGATVAAGAAQQATADFMAKARPEIESRTEELANKAVADALARRQKTSTMKTYGMQAAVSAAVFAVGTLTMVGVDKFRHRNDRNANMNNPQYTGDQAT